MRLGSVVLSALLLAGCGAAPWRGDAAPSTQSAPTIAASSPTAAPSTAASPTPTPSPTVAEVRTSPLTGLPEEAPAPVLIVKLDNTRNAQPHVGLEQADIVYLEEVEWGLTRIAAVFSSRIPDRIGPVRSARITDIDLIAQFGSPAVAYSGAQRKLLPVLARAGFVDVSAHAGPQGYSRDSSRRAPYNYFLDGSTALERGADAALSKDIGFVFDAEPPAGGEAVRSIKAEWPYASARFRYDEATGAFKVAMNGEPARAEGVQGALQADTVVIQYVRQVDSGYGDRSGGVTPLAKTVGEGTGLVARDGRIWEVRWSRPSPESGTTYTLLDGSPMPFKPGQTWVVLLDKARAATVSGTASPSASASASPAQ